MNPAKEIIKALNQYVYELAEAINEKHEEVPVQDVVNMWCRLQGIPVTDFSQMMKLSKMQVKQQKKVEEVTTAMESMVIEPAEVKASPTQKSLKLGHVKSSVTRTPSNALCSYIYARGEKKGQRCQTVAKTGSMCSRHKK